MENDKIKLEETQQVKLIDVFKRFMQYIGDNKGTFTFLTASAVSIGSVIIRVIAYLIEYGKIKYYNISPSLINVSEDNVFYEFFVYGVFALIFILLNLLPYFVWKGNMEIWKKVICSLFIVLIPEVIFGFCLLIDYINKIHYSISDIGITFLCVFLFGLALFALGLINGIGEYCSKSNSESTTKKKDKDKLSKSTKIAIFIAVFLTIESVLFIFVGFTEAVSETQFKVITGDNTQYVVIYENSDKYVITQCNIKDKTITFLDIDAQEEINRDEVEYKWQRFTKKEVCT